jgi:hypothetical protein
MGERKMRGLFVHMPKCAGASVRALLESMHPEGIVFDYVSHFRIPLPERIKTLEIELGNPAALPGNGLVYGHFFPARYLGKGHNSELKLTTILRDPLERMRSHYVYWNAGQFDHYLWDKMKAENWSFADFAFSAEMRNFYAQYNIYVPVERYDYIGLYENLEISVRNCCAAVGLNLPKDAIVPHTNANPERRDDLISTIDRNAFRLWHAEDYAFYEAAKQRFHPA